MASPSDEGKPDRKVRGKEARVGAAKRGLTPSSAHRQDSGEAKDMRLKMGEVSERGDQNLLGKKHDAR